MGQSNDSTYSSHEVIVRSILFNRRQLFFHSFAFDETSFHIVIFVSILSHDSLHISLFTFDSSFLNWNNLRLIIMIFTNLTNMNPTKKKRPVAKPIMPSPVASKKRVSFGDSSNTIHAVENFKLSLDTPSQHDKVWYGPAEMHRFYEDECAYQQKRAAAVAYKKAYRPRRSSITSSSRLVSSRHSSSRRSDRRPRRNSLPASSDKEFFPKSPCKRELFDQQTQAIRNLRLAASTQYSNFLARNQQKHQAPVHKITRSTTEALAATRFPHHQQYTNHQRQLRKQTRQPEIGRVRAVFFSG